MKSRLRKGEIAEALFVAKALGLGMNVSKPFGQNCRYDFMVEVMGRATRVQVKSTWQEKVASRWSLVASEEKAGPSARAATRPKLGREEGQSRRSLGMTGQAGRSRLKPAGMAAGKQYLVRAGGTTTRGARRYRASEVDYIAAYVAPEDEWYVIPVGRIPSAFTIVLPGKYARYREAWDQLCPRGTYVGDIQAAADPKYVNAAPEGAGVF